MPKPIGLRSRKWRTLAARRLAQAKASGEPCCRCGAPIDYELPPRTKWSATVDHLDERANGGPVLAELHRLAPSHLRCNSSWGAGRREWAEKAEEPMRNSQEW